MTSEERQILFLISFSKGLRYVGRNIRDNEEFDTNFEQFSDDLLGKIDLEGLAKKLGDIREEVENNSLDKTTADLKLAREIHNYLGEISLKTAANSEFWNGMALLDNKIYNFITWRWGYHSQKFFRKNQHVDRNKESSRIKRYITSSSVSALRKQTLARVWWIAKLFPKEYQDLIWRQQDAVDRILEHTFGALDDEGKINDLIQLFIELYQEFDQRGRFANNRQEKIRRIISWLKALEDYIFIDNLNRNDLKEMIKQIFKTIISAFGS